MRSPRSSQVSAAEADVDSRRDRRQPAARHAEDGIRHSGTLAALLDRREQSLDGDTRAVLDLAATLGAEFDADLLAAGHGAPLLSVLELLERRRRPGSWCPSRPARPFLRSSTRCSAPTGTSSYRCVGVSNCTRSAAAALNPRSGDERLLPERARHACLAVPICDARAAVDLARERAGVTAERAYAYDEAAPHYRRGARGGRAPRSSRPAGVARPHGPPRLPRSIATATPTACRCCSTRAGSALGARATTRHSCAIAMSFAPVGASGSFSGPDPEQMRSSRTRRPWSAPSRARSRPSVDRARRPDWRRPRRGERGAGARGRGDRPHIGDHDVLGRVLLTARPLAGTRAASKSTNALPRARSASGQSAQPGADTPRHCIGRAVRPSRTRRAMTAWNSGSNGSTRCSAIAASRFFQLDAGVDAGAQDVPRRRPRAARRDSCSDSHQLAIALGHPPGIWTGGHVINVGGPRPRTAR